MNRHSVYQQTQIAPYYEIDYSVYLQRGRQEQARAMRQLASGLTRWFKQWLSASHGRRSAVQHAPLAEPVSHCS
jgi:hypothetical protein